MTGRGGQGREQALADLHDRLLAAADALTDSDAWRATLAVAARFHTYSPNNVLLITIQRPDATRVAGYRAWTRLGRQVRRGERGIAILAPVLNRPAVPDATGQPPTAGANMTQAESNRPPNREPNPNGERDREPPGTPTPRRTLVGFRPTYVFDIAQTDGPPLPEVRPALLDGAAPLRLWAGLCEQVAAAGYTLGYTDLAPANGRTDFLDRTVLLHEGLPAAQRAKTLAHELAHVRLHAPGHRPEGLSRAQAEVEAESVAYIVTAAHGLASEDYTVPYVTNWAGGNRELLTATATRVLGCARTILADAPPPPATPDPATPGLTADRQRPEPAGRPGLATDLRVGHASRPARGVGR